MHFELSQGFLTVPVGGFPISCLANGQKMRTTSDLIFFQMENYFQKKHKAGKFQELQKKEM